MKLTNKIKSEIVDYVLKNVNKKDFQAGINDFSCQRIYAKCKRALMSEYPELMYTDLRYAVALSEAFEEYKVPEIECKELDRELTKLRKLCVSRNLAMSKKYKYRSEYNEKVMYYNSLLEPQMKLIMRFKQVQNEMEA